MTVLSRFIRVASAALILAIPAFAAYSFVTAGSAVSGTTTSQVPAMIQVGNSRSTSRTSEQERSKPGVENVELRNFSYTGRPVPSPFSVK